MDHLFDRPCDTEAAEELTHSILGRYPHVEMTTVGRSLCGRPLSCFTVGRGKKTVLYLGAHHGSEWITGLLLYRFLSELGQGSAPVGADAGRLLERVRFWILPVVNPDGVELAIHGPTKGGVLEARQRRINGESEDFSTWQANARGVDLNHNYGAGFSEYKCYEREHGISGPAPTLYSGMYPESEPESSAVASLVRALRPPLILTLPTQGEAIFYGGEDALTGSFELALKVSALTGYAPRPPTGSAAFGGLTDWAVRCGIPALTLECGKGKNPLPLSCQREVYRRLRPALFRAPDFVS